MKKLTALCLLLTSCAAPDQVFVQGSRDAYDAIAPEYRLYVTNDPLLDDAQKLRRMRTLERWNSAIQMREGK